MGLEQQGGVLVILLMISGIAVTIGPQAYHAYKTKDDFFGLYITLFIVAIMVLFAVGYNIFVKGY